MFGGGNILFWNHHAWEKPCDCNSICSRTWATFSSANAQRAASSYQAFHPQLRVTGNDEAPYVFRNVKELNFEKLAFHHFSKNQILLWDMGKLWIPLITGCVSWKIMQLAAAPCQLLHPDPNSSMALSAMLAALCSARCLFWQTWISHNKWRAIWQQTFAKNKEKGDTKD